MKKVLLTLTMLLFAFTGVMRASAEQGNVRADQVIEQGFEDGLGDWTMNHCHSSSGVSSGYGGNTGNYAFRFYYTTNYPQYLISPELDDNDGVNFTFYAARYSSSYPETFKVGYSSTTNDPTEFTWGSEVTCTTMYGAGAYQEYSYDFPAGTKYVAIACTSNDQFYMFVDDITVTATEPAPAPTPGEIVEVTIGDPTSTAVNSYIPGYTLYDYAISQQIYTADEIGVAGTIETLTMWLKNNSSYARNINVYMKEVEATEFASNTAWESFTAADMVASFTIENAYNAPIEFAIPLSTPFEYSGTGNLVICFQDVTGSWSSGLGGVEMAANGNQSLYAYRDGTVYDPSNPGVNGTLLAKKNVIKLSIMTSGGGAQTAFSTTPDVLDLGYRPNGAWMAPYVFNLKSNVGAVTVNALDFSGNYFTYNAELPATVSGNNPLEVAVSTGTAEAGEVNSTITVLYSGNDRDAEQLDIKATAYDPVDGDVYENAVNVTSFPYAGNAPAGIYKNYELPVATEGADAVYKMTFANDVMLTAGTTGADGVAALYTEDFAGEGGPMADNNYVYEGPTVNPGPTSLWFNYAYTGSNTWYGTSAGGGFYFGYKISTDVIAAENLAGLTITTVEAAAREAYPYYCFIIEGGADPFEGNMISMGTIENPTALYFFDINLEEPAYISGNEDVWVIFYSDSPYAAYCGRYPADVNNGKIWTCNPNATTPQWTSNTNYTPVIYCHMLELPTGRTATMDLAKMEVKKGNGVVSEIAEAEGNVMNVAKAQIANNNSRDVIDNNIEDMYVKAGTYYLVAASTEAEFPVSIEVADVPAPEQAIVIYPYDGETNVTAPYYAEWILGDYTEEMQVLVGTQYPPQTALIDWTDYLVESAFIMDLEPNQSYFMQVNERNAAGTTMGEIIAFTTPIDPVEGLVIAESQLYPGDAAVLTWDAATRSHKGYNVYMYDGVEITKVNETLITETTYAVEGLEYNMDPGYQFVVTAVYDAGESDYSDYVTAQMTGNGTVSGYVYDTDVDHPVAFATVGFLGLDEYMQETYTEFTTDEEGFFTGELLAGLYAAGVISEGYATEAGAQVVAVEYGQSVEDLVFITHEFYYPLNQITATEEENDVLVEWSWDPAEMIVDFETGDFSQAEFTLPATYPWAITTVNPYEGTYCMKSTCEGVASGSSVIEATVDVPFEEAKMGFYVRVSSESNYDKFHFYIDGVEQGSALSGQADYVYKEYAVTGGVHTYKWEYTKDSSVNSNDDCIYVDNITMFRKDEPIPPTPGATVYDFDDDSMMGWTSIDADGDGNGWVSSANPGIYHNSGVNLSGTGHNDSEAYVISGSYANGTGQALTPDNYLVAPAQISAQDGASISFWACAQDASYAAEHFGVAVSTTGHTSGNDFTTIQEWTMTAKGPQGKTADAERDIRGTRQGSWYSYTVDLSSYAGQDIWVAIRHFNCTDMFILNVDDITLYDGSAKGIDRGNRSFMSYNLYRRNNYSEESVANPELIAEGLAGDVYEYIDAEWPTLSFGEWQWGIAATYEGYAPVPDRNREVYTYTFDSGLEGWTNIDADGDGEVWFNSSQSQTYSCYDYSTLGHNGTGCFMVSQSYTDCTYDAYNANNFLVSPQKYPIDANSSITFWQDWANDSYPDYYEVMVSTAANPTATDFTTVWSVGSKNHGNGAKIRNINNRYENWTEYNVSLASYAGQEVWIAFRHQDYDNYELWLDDVTITCASGVVPPTPPTPTPAGDGISEILWSNVIEKDMEATLTFNITLNNGQSPVGAAIEIVGDEDTYSAVAEGATTTVEVRKAPTYEMTVTLDGYSSWTLTEAVEADATYDIELIEQVDPVDGLYVSPTGWAMWEGVGGVTPGPGPGPQPGNEVTYGFEADEEGWTSIDADGDGYGWYSLNPTNNTNNIPGHNNSVGHMTSASYQSVALYPNNYLVSPEKGAYTQINFWACGQDASWAAEHFGVAVSTTGNTSASDFTTIQEWTMTAKGSGVASVGRDGQTRDQGTWYEYTVDLSSYAGQEIWVAIRHFNVSDMFRLNVDDITLSMGSRNDRAPLKYVVKLDGVVDGETTFNGFQHNVEGMEEGSTHVTAVRPVYISGNGDWVEYTWTYTSCDNFAGVDDLEAAEQGNDVKLTWTMPGTPGPGPGPQPGGGEFTEDFEGGLNGWNVLTILADGGSWIHSSNNLGGYDYTTLAHGGTGFAMCYSFVDYVGSFNTDSYMYTPEMYTIGNGSTLTFWADNANDSYPESFSVVISTSANPSSAADFTTVWSGSAKGTRSDGAMVRHTNNRYENWRQHTVDLSAYAGQTVYIGFHDVNYDMYEVWIDDVELGIANKGNRDAWDLVYNFSGTSAGQQAVATDGNYIYTASWQTTPTGGHTFYQYDLQGNFIEGFEIAGATGIRDLTTDGQYFYGSSGAAQIFCMDFTTRTLVSTINCSGLTSRHLSYDPVRDGFWSGNWSTLALYSRTGALIQNGPAPESAYGSAYYAEADGTEHIYLFCQPNSDAKVYDYNIATNTISGPIFDFAATPGFDGIAGGCFIGNYDNKLCWFGNSQQDPNLIGIYELEGGAPVPPQPVEGILGAMIFQDGEPIAFVEGNPTQYVVEGAASYDATYGVRVVYGGEYDVTYYAMSCMEEVDYSGTVVPCNPVANLTAVQGDNNGAYGAIVSWTEPAGATGYKIYADGSLLGQTTGQPVFINFEGAPAGTYTIGVVAVYAECESDMVTVDFLWTPVSVDELSANTNIYPNPTHDNVTIEAKGMRHITVVSALGQVVYDADIEADMTQLNLGQFKAGLYMVRIDTENGTVVKRVSVVK